MEGAWKALFRLGQVDPRAKETNEESDRTDPSWARTKSSDDSQKNKEIV